ncbi:hypothetical protein [Chamaesiphon sp. OTE_75_metabat_556]|jgi:hypothetical protein|uniref:hypothetical protein n=1 Tax=Chamaesiphon sp. OTE_75_metabat_556 TaxID=2964692 RepID=UPI00286ACA04|nr:hypothetical protein [Chamaesiphon sp. OTE_75_metabat_556]
MKLDSLLWGLAKIVENGELKKTKENILDEASPKIQELFGLIQRKLPQTKTAKSLAARQSLDRMQVAIDVEPIEKDPELVKLLAEFQPLITKELRDKFETEAAKAWFENILLSHEQFNNRSQANQFNVPHVTLTNRY